MASVSSVISGNFPHLVTAVSELRHIKTVKPKVFRAFMKYTKMSEEEASIAMFPWQNIFKSLGLKPVGFAHDKAPLFVLDRFEKKGKYAEYRGNGNEIDMQGWFLVSHNWALDFKTPEPKKEKIRLLMESKLLHEMVHWARRKKGLQADLDNGGEAGQNFEKDAYQMYNTSHSLGLKDYI